MWDMHLKTFFQMLYVSPCIVIHIIVYLIHLKVGGCICCRILSCSLSCKAVNSTSIPPAIRSQPKDQYATMDINPNRHLELFRDVSNFHGFHYLGM